LRRKFAQGEVADAWLAAYAEHLAVKAGIQPPNWVFASSRILAEPSLTAYSFGYVAKAMANLLAPKIS
jgi:hypothetical protein